MFKDDQYFFRHIENHINGCEKAKKFAACITSTKQSGKMLVYILTYLIKDAWGAVFIRYMCKCHLTVDDLFVYN